jgi:ribonucleoside-triphosphate reductase
MKVKKIKKSGEKFTVDIEVGNTHSYQLENRSVVHNTSSLVLGTSSGIHAWYDKFFVRRMRVGKNEGIYKFLNKKIPQLLEDEFFKPQQQGVISIPVKAPENALMRSESPIETLERVKYFSENWILPGHNDGQNTHNISATINLKPEDWEEVGEWMWKNRVTYNGLSVIPYDNGTYKQAPFEAITEEKYNELYDYLVNINMEEIIEYEDNTDLTGELACANGSCELVM